LQICSTTGPEPAIVSQSTPAAAAASFVSERTFATCSSSALVSSLRICGYL